MMLPFIKQTWEDRIKRKGREHNLSRCGFDHKAVLFTFSHWTMESKKPQKSRLTVGFCSVPRTGMLQYFSLRVQLLISQTFPMALPARSRRHRTPEGSSGPRGFQRAAPARSGSSRHTAPDTAATAPQELPQKLREAGKHGTDSWLAWASFP